MAQAIADLRAMREKQQNKVKEARAVMAALTDDSSAADIAEANRQHDGFMVEYDSLQGRIDREEQLIEREAKLNQRDGHRPRGDDREIDPGAAATPKQERAAAYKSYLRYGLDGLSPAERKLIGPQRSLGDPGEQRAQGIADSTAGGFLVPEGFMDELVVSLKMYGPMLDPGVTREIATTAGNLIPWPSMDDTANQGRRLTENTVVNTAQLAFGVHNLYAFKYTTDVVLVSNELLQDSAVDPEQIIRDAMAIRLGRVVNNDLTVGTGASMPTGIAYAATTPYVAASSTAIGFDDMIETEHGLDPEYRKMPGVRWQFHDTTLKALRKLKDGDGQYIWQPASVIAKAPPTILGYDYEINQAVAQIATGQKSVIFGDHQRYVVRRVKEFLVRRLNERYADLDQVGFIGFGRYDGALVDAKGVVALVHP